MQMATLKSAYIHIPFCKNICSYCDFCKNFYNKKLVSDYLEALKKEIKSKYNNELLDTIYIGGGTPSCLDNDSLKSLFDAISILKLSTDYEFTFECNYEDINDHLLSILKNNGVNRISIGIQTLNKRFENLLERKINKDEMINAIKLSKKYFKNINIDLMYGLNSQTLKDLEDDLKIITELNVNHISTYSLIIENHTKLGNKNTKEIDEDLISDMYYKIIKTLKDSGYKHYEISNFKKEGYESKHNLTYWNNDYYYGFGAGASGFLNNIRYDNTKSIKNYINGTTTVYKENVSDIQLIKDEVMLNLRKSNGINKNTFKNKYNVSIKDVFNLDFLLDNNLLEENENQIFIPEDKLFISNEIILNVFENML